MNKNIMKFVSLAVTNTGFFRVKAFDEGDAERKVYDDDWVNEFTDEDIENSFIEEINECD